MITSYTDTRIAIGPDLSLFKSFEAVLKQYSNNIVYHARNSKIYAIELEAEYIDKATDFKEVLKQKLKPSDAYVLFCEDLTAKYTEKYDTGYKHRYKSYRIYIYHKGIIENTAN